MPDSAPTYRSGRPMFEQRTANIEPRIYDLVTIINYFSTLFKK